MVKLHNVAVEKDLFSISNMSYNDKMQKMHVLRSRITCNDTGLKGLLTFVNHVVVKEEEDLFNTVAFTDGDSMYFGDYFFSMEMPIQCAVILHEMFHIVFRHLFRGRNRIHRLFNIATDCIINNSIGFKDKAQLNCSQPIYLKREECLSLESVYKSFNIKEEDRKPLNEWNSESLYEFLLIDLKKQLENELKNQNSCFEKNKKGDLKGSSNSDKKNKSNETNNSNKKKATLSEIEERVEEIYNELAKKHKLFAGDDIKEGQNKNQDINDTINNAIWTSRYNRAKAQSNNSSNSILGRINPDVYKPQIKWERELRKFLVKSCMPETVNNFNKPSRNLAAIKTKTNTFLPGIKNKKGLDKMMVIIDTSGSCFNETELTMFCSEIQSVQQKTGVEIALIFADTKIQSEYIVKNDGTKLLDKIKQNKIVAKGGGGTDMITPFVEGKKKYNPIVSVIASDGYCDFPNRKQVQGTNLLWVLNTNIIVPKEAGRALYLNHNF